MGEERSDEGKNCSVLNKKEFMFPQSTLCLSWVFPLSVLTSQAPACPEPRLTLETVFTKREIPLYREQQKKNCEGSLQYHCSRDVKQSAFLSLLPCFLGPPGESGTPSPWAPDRCARFSEGWAVGGHGVSWSSLTAGLALQQSFMERKRESLILNVFTKNEREEGEGSLYKTKQKPLESSQKLHTF